MIPCLDQERIYFLWSIIQQWQAEKAAGYVALDTLIELEATQTDGLTTYSNTNM